MAYDAELADRVRAVLASRRGITEMRMFGGLAFLVGGHMAVAASGSGGLLLRCAPEQTAELLAEPHVGRFEMQGREMTGWLRIDDGAVSSDDDLRRWIDVGVSYASSLPPKEARVSPRRRAAQPTA